MSKMVARLACWKPKRPVGADDFFDAEAEIKQSMWRVGLIPPDSKGKKKWELFLLILVAYTALELPLLWAFDVTPEVGMLIFDYIVDVFFWVDIAISSRTSFRTTETNELVFEKEIVVRHYLTTWMVRARRPQTRPTKRTTTPFFFSRLTPSLVPPQPSLNLSDSLFSRPSHFCHSEPFAHPGRRPPRRLPL